MSVNIITHQKQTVEFEVNCGQSGALLVAFKTDNVDRNIVVIKGNILITCYRGKMFSLSAYKSYSLTGNSLHIQPLKVQSHPASCCVLCTSSNYSASFLDGNKPITMLLIS
jgi:hypothetical protein